MARVVCAEIRDSLSDFVYWYLLSNWLSVWIISNPSLAVSAKLWSWPMKFFTDTPNRIAVKNHNICHHPSDVLMSHTYMSGHVLYPGVDASCLVYPGMLPRRTTDSQWETYKDVIKELSLTRELIPKDVAPIMKEIYWFEKSSVCYPEPL
jgi:hypothetical protein